MTRLLLFVALIMVVIAVAVVAVIPHSQEIKTWTSNIETVGLPEHRLELVGPKHPTFYTLIAEEASRAYKGNAKLFSVFVLNNAEQSVAACALKWELLLPNGQIATHFRTEYSNLHTVSDGGSAHLASLIAAKKKQLFSLADSPGSNKQPARGIGFSTSGSDIINRQLSESVKVTVSIEGVLFVDGTFVGPDSKNYFELLRGRIEASRELDAELSQLIDSGAEPDAIINFLETVSRSQSINAQIPPGEDPQYSSGKWLARKSYAGRLLLMVRGRRNQAVLEHIRAELRKPQVTLRRL